MSLPSPTFGSILKDWRNLRKISQLELSFNAGISQRHISFLETGRARPSRQSVLTLAESLDVPLRERNVLLHAAGFAPVFSAAPLESSGMELFRHALDITLQHHEPYPAVVLNGRWNLIKANDAALRLFSCFVEPAKLLADPGRDFQVVRLCLSDEGLRPCIQNWAELVFAFLTRIRRLLVQNPTDEGAKGIVEEIVSHPDAPQRWRDPQWTTLDPVVPMRLSKDALQVDLFTMLAHFGSAQDIVLDELKVELFFPANPHSQAFLRELAGADSSPTEQSRSERSYR